MTRLYAVTPTTPRCTRCQTPMVPFGEHKVHPTCEPGFYRLKARANRALGMSKASA